MIHASYDTKPPPRGDKPASYDTRKKKTFFRHFAFPFSKIHRRYPQQGFGGGGGEHIYISFLRNALENGKNNDDGTH